MIPRKDFSAGSSQTRPSIGSYPSLDPTPSLSQHSISIFPNPSHCLIFNTSNCWIRIYILFVELLEILILRDFESISILFCVHYLSKLLVLHRIGTKLSKVRSSWITCLIRQSVRIHQICIQHTDLSPQSIHLSYITCHSCFSLAFNCISQKFRIIQLRQIYIALRNRLH